MEAGRPAALIARIECESCGRIDKPAREFNYPEDMAEGASLFVWLPCERKRPVCTALTRWMPSALGTINPSLGVETD
jgi:hypothetical protein